MKGFVMKFSKVHPYTIAEYLSRFALIVILPLLQQIIFLLFQPYNIFDWLSLFGFNLLFTLIVIFWCFLEYRCIGYHVDDRSLSEQRGIIVKHIRTIPYKCIHSLTIKHTLFASLFGATKLNLDTPAGKKTKPDISFTLSKKELNKAVSTIFPEEHRKLIYHASPLRIILMSASWSNSVSGLLLAAPFINKIGSILGEEFSEKIYSTVDFSAQFIAVGVPPIAAGIAYALAAGWIIALLVQFFRYARFTVSQSGENTIISRGLLLQSERIINLENINAISVKQTLLMRILGLFSAYINIIGLQKEKGDRSMLVAAASYSELKKLVVDLIEISLNLKREIIPPKKALKSFCWLPLSLFLINILILIIFYTVNGIRQLFLFLSLFSAPFFLWWMLLRIQAYKTSGLSLSSNKLTIRGYYHLSLIASIIPFDKIQFLSIHQNPFQRRSGLCNVRVYIFSERKEYFTVKQLPYLLVENLVESMENLMQFP